MKLIVGLGNPGEKYKNNRHNTGFAVVDKLQTEISKSKFLISKKIQIFKSKNFMNNSGTFVKELLSQYPSILISSIYVVHDDLDLPLGTWKLQLGKGPKDHGGINDIEHKLDTDNFWRIRVGVNNREPGPHFTKVTRGEDYVLQDFTDKERKVLDGVISEICKKLGKF